MNKNEIRLRRTTFTVTVRCTLRCKLCSIYAASYCRPPHYSADHIANELDRYFQIADYVEWLQYSGGEPFLNKELPQMVEYAMRYGDRFDKLMIFANGTVLPDRDMLETFKKYSDRLHFFFSNYGEASHKGKELIDCFRSHALSFTEKKYYGDHMLYDGWVDFGGWERRNHTEQELAGIFEVCGMHTMGFSVVQDGELHLCRRSFHGMHFKLMEHNAADYIDLMDASVSVEEKRAQLRKLLALPYIQACDYCNATYGSKDPSVRRRPAEQFTREEALLQQNDAYKGAYT